MRGMLRGGGRPAGYGPALGARLARPLSTATCDVVIVGGGVIGTSVALHLALRDPNMRIKVLERDSTYTNASAPRSAGGIRQQFSLRQNVQLSMYGAEFLQRGLADLLPAGADVRKRLNFVEAGYLTLARFGDQATKLKACHETQVSAGADWITFMDRDALRQRFPWLDVGDEHIACGAFGERNEGYFDPWALLELSRDAARAVGRNVEFVRDTGATGLVLDRCRLVGVKVAGRGRADDGDAVHAAVVVNAAGAHSAALLAGAVGDEIAELPISPRKRCIFAVSCPPPAPNDRFPRPPPNAPLTIAPSGAYFRGDLRDGRFLCGVSPPEDADPDVTDLADLEDVDHSLFESSIWPALAEVAPALESLRVEASWAGLYEYNTLDQNGVVGWHPSFDGGLMLATGFSGHGLQHAPGVGRAVAELVVDGTFQTIDLAPFSFDRVAKNMPFKEQGIY
ncbi:FAD dependent oxidoreductase [Pelagophyceae sp. CCMP2097]|nr:FAD dependent oxidoreductase [Pelagophyceae sp. CCMP2097]